MSSHKRVLLIVALAMVIFGTVAIGPLSTRKLTAVQASPEPPATVILLCTTVAPLPPPTVFIPPVVEQVEDSDTADSFLKTIATNSSCAVALQTIFNAGFRMLGSAAGGSTGLANHTAGLDDQIVHTTQYTLVRGGWQDR